MATAQDQSEHATGSRGRARRRTALVAIGAVFVVAILITKMYAERRVIDENERVQQVAQSTTVEIEDVIDAAYGSEAVAVKFEVASDRVGITVDSTRVCIVVRSEYLGSARTAAFIVDDRATLTPIDHC